MGRPVSHGLFAITKTSPDFQEDFPFGLCAGSHPAVCCATAQTLITCCHILYGWLLGRGFAEGNSYIP